MRWDRQSNTEGAHEANSMKFSSHPSVSVSRATSSRCRAGEFVASLAARMGSYSRATPSILMSWPYLAGGQGGLRIFAVARLLQSGCASMSPSVPLWLERSGDVSARWHDWKELR